MASRTLRDEDIFGLAFAGFGHLALLGLLIFARPAAPPPPPERMTVTISDVIGPQSSSPDPTANPAPDKGPELGEPAPVPEPVASPEPQPAPKPTAPPPPQRASTVPAPKAPPKPPQQAQKAPAKAPPTKTPPRQAGASSFDQAFGAGIPGGTGKAKTPPGSKASAQVVASWQNSIKAKVGGPWQRCPVSGLEVEKLTAVVTFTLRKDGSVASIDTVSVSGQTASNQAQVRPFKDCAVRAIKLAAPFAGLPADFYDQWKVRELTFRKGNIR